MNNMPKKPETHEEQTSVLWDVMCNHVMSKLKTQDIKQNITLGGLAFIAIMIAILGIVVAVVVM
ncbi:hypothetical protein LCGC14_0396880 [marine sediment metagenome]|uniref:Uncharacterized protein n=1 Tax=marine sediment metagenome TaxID=412755 RepID=A0A0F9VK66_9ZZZZ